jgi:hypothetical protein
MRRSEMHGGKGVSVRSKYIKERKESRAFPDVMNDSNVTTQSSMNKESGF